MNRIGNVLNAHANRARRERIAALNEAGRWEIRRTNKRTGKPGAAVHKTFQGRNAWEVREQAQAEADHMNRCFPDRGYVVVEKI